MTFIGALSADVPCCFPAALVINRDNFRRSASISKPYPLAINVRNAVTYLPTFRLFFGGEVSNDYRIREDVVEFRTNEGAWRVLDDSDLAIHFRFDTEVARWLRRRLLEENPHGRSSR